MVYARILTRLTCSPVVWRAGPQQLSRKVLRVSSLNSQCDSFLNRRWLGNSQTVASHTPSIDKTSNVRIESQELVNVLDANSEPLGVMSKQEAEELAESRQLRLVLLDPTSKPHPTFEIMSGKQLAMERKTARQLSKDNRPKSAKSVHLKSSVMEHDLQIKLKHIEEWLAKGHEVKVWLKNANSRTGSSKGVTGLFKTLSEHMELHGVVKAVSHAHGDMKFTLKPHELDQSAHKDLKPLKHKDLKKLRHQSEEGKS